MPLSIFDKLANVLRSSFFILISTSRLMYPVVYFYPPIDKLNNVPRKILYNVYNVYNVYNDCIMIV